VALDDKLPYAQIDPRSLPCISFLHFESNLEPFVCFYSTRRWRKGMSYRVKPSSHIDNQFTAQFDSN
jgi:hypothetical protein